MQVATMLLNPMSNEFTATFVGRLIITIVTKAGNLLGENIQLLLKAVISKLQLVEALNVVMSLVMTFAHLIITQMDAVLNFLSTVPGPTGKLESSFGETKEKLLINVLLQVLSQPFSLYCPIGCRVSQCFTVPTSEKLVQWHFVSSSNTVLPRTMFVWYRSRFVMWSIRLQLKMEIDLEHVNNRTMSSNNGLMFLVSEILLPIHTNNFLIWLIGFVFFLTVLVKIFKLLINELNHLNESILFGDESDGSDDDNDLNDEADPNQPQNGTSPQKVFHASDLWYDDDEDEDDQLLKELEQDPIFQTSLKETLTKFLQNFTTTDKFAEYAQHLNENEKNVLRGIQVNI